MLRFACDWCQRLKEAGETWILGFAAENLGATASRREVTVLNEWDLDRAVNPFAVHFCSIAHKDNYMQALFESGPARNGKLRKAVATVEVHQALPARRVATAPKRKPTSRRRAS